MNWEARADEIEARCREAWSTEGLSPKTINAYVMVLRRASRWSINRGSSLLELTATDVRELAVEWPRTRSSRQQLRITLARVWEATEGHPELAQAVPVPTKPRYRCRALSEPAAATLAAAARRSEGPAGFAVLLGLYAGLRREEIAGLRFDQFAGGWLRVVGKREVAGEIPVHPALTERLEVARLSRVSSYVFPGRAGGHIASATVWNWTRRVSRIAIGQPVSPHVLRHTAIATLNDATHDLRAAQEFARHLSPETTVLYTRVDRRRLEDAVASIDYAGA